MSLKQTRSCRVADNYHQAPQKCQYVKLGAVCEMNEHKWRSRGLVLQACQKWNACGPWHFYLVMTADKSMHRSNVSKVLNITYLINRIRSLVIQEKCTILHSIISRYWLHDTKSIFWIHRSVLSQWYIFNI